MEWSNSKRRRTVPLEKGFIVILGYLILIKGEVELTRIVLDSSLGLAYDSYFFISLSHRTLISL